MPIENEVKFIIETFSEEHILGIGESSTTIRQGYLQRESDLTVRIRKQIFSNKEVRHWFTFKKRVDEKVVEIEQIISDRDFEKLATQAHSWLHKVRVNVGEWEVDYFKDNGTTYFSLAEIELDEDQEFPSEIPDFIGEYLLYSVPKNDKRFSSKKLANISYAKKLMSSLSLQTAFG